MRYFLDGNNLAGAWFKSAGAEGSGEHLLIFLQRQKLPKETTIVFDGACVRSSVEKGALKVIYSGRRTADEVILERIGRGDVVVTRDRELQSKAKVRRAGFLEPGEFLEKIRPKDGGAEKPLREDDIEGWMKIFGE